MAYELNKAVYVLENLNLAQLSTGEYQTLVRLLEACDDKEKNPENSNNALLDEVNKNFWEGLEKKVLKEDDEIKEVNPEVLSGLVKELKDVLVKKQSNEMLEVVNLKEEGDVSVKKTYATQRLLRAMILGEIPKHQPPEVEENRAQKLTRDNLRALALQGDRGDFLKACGFTLEGNETGSQLNDDKIISTESFEHLRWLALETYLQDKPETFKQLKNLEMARLTDENLKNFEDNPDMVTVLSAVIVEKENLREVIALMTGEKAHYAKIMAQCDPKLETLEDIKKFQEGLKNRPELVKLLASYIRQEPPIPMQTVIAGLQQARSRHQVMQIMGTYTGAHDLGEENKHFQLLDRIENAALRDVMKGLPRSFFNASLDPEKIEQLNAFLRNPEEGDNAVDLSTLKGYQILCNKIHEIFSVKDKNQLNVALGLNKAGDAFTEGYKDKNKEEEKGQYQQSRHVANQIQKQHELKSTSKDWIFPFTQLLDHMTRDFALTTNDNGISAVQALFKNAASFADLEKQLKAGDNQLAWSKRFKLYANGGEKAFSEIFPHCDTELTEDKFWEMKIAAYEVDELKKFHDDQKKDIKTLDTAYKVFEKSLKIFQDMDAPAWQSYFTSRGTEDQGKQLETFAKQCDELYEQYAAYRQRLMHIQDGYKLQNPQNKVIIEEIQKQCDNIYEKMKQLIAFSELYHGNKSCEKSKLRQEGLSHRLQATTSPSQDMILGTAEEISCKTFSLKQKEERAQLTWENGELIKKKEGGEENKEDDKQHTFASVQDEVNLSRQAAPVENQYTALNKLKPGEYHEIAMKMTSNSGDSVYARYTMEKTAGTDTSSAWKVKGQNAAYQANAGIKIGVLDWDMLTDNDQKIAYAVRLAASMIATYGKNPPDKHHPIYLNGKDIKKRQYLYTALVLLGREDKNCKFSPDAIKVTYSSFDPKTEYRYGSFNRNSLYNNHKAAFKSYVTNQISQAEGYRTELFGNKEGDKQVKKIGSTISTSTQEMKKGLEELKKPVEDNPLNNNLN